MSYVTTKQLTKSFGDNTVFENVDFTIDQGEFITLLGPSGCGKSTLLRSLAGLNPVDQGEIWVNGENITHQSPQERGIGMVFQSYALFPNMTVESNIAFGLKMKKVLSDEVTKLVSNVIELVDLKGKEKQYPHQLSGGQRQRVALARALVVKPRILLLDEPLSALDAKIRKHLRQQIRDIQKEMNLTTIFVTHDQEEAMIMSDRIFLMNQGEIVQAGSPEEIYTQPANEFVAGFMGHYNLIDSSGAKALLDLDTPNKVAIRPESIYVKEEGRQYAQHISSPRQGVIKSHQLLGNIIRYQVAVEECELTVDLLNRSSERLIPEGSSLELLFNLNEIQPVGTKMTQPLYVFDMDETLIDADCAMLWNAFLVRKGIIAEPGFLEQDQRLMRLYAQGKMDMEDYLEFSIAPLASLPVEEVNRLVEECVLEEILVKQFTQSKDLIEQLRQQQVQMVIISASVSFLVSVVGHHIGIDNTLGIDLVTKQGCYTPEISGIASYREGKVLRLKEWIESQPECFSEIHFYTDSINDLPLCEFADYAYLVNPCPALKAYSDQENWQVLEWSVR